jgi:ferritin
MAMKESVRKLFNEQITREYYAAYLYLSMSEWLIQNGYIGAAHWMAVQYDEEIGHAEGLYRYLQLRGEKIELEAIEKPKSSWTSLANVFEDALAHEQEITAAINRIADEAEKAGDRAALLFLNWYILEQVEEEDNQNNNLLCVERCQGDMAAIFAFDSKLGEREYGRDEIPNL